MARHGYLLPKNVGFVTNPENQHILWSQLICESEN